jgi:hypothetical protein
MTKNTASEHFSIPDIKGFIKFVAGRHEKSVCSTSLLHGHVNSAARGQTLPRSADRALAPVSSETSRHGKGRDLEGADCETISRPRLVEKHARI